MAKRTNWQEFKDVLDRHNIHKLYHFTDRDNLEAIIKNGGLYSWKDCEEKNRLSRFLAGIIFYTREVLLTHSFHLKRISVGNRRKSIACVINKNERNLASTI